jgi:hypothetical protein
MAEQAVRMTLQRFDEESEESISQLTFSCLPALRDSVVRARRLRPGPCGPADTR